MSRATRHWVGLYILILVTGCASIPGERLLLGHVPVALAMSSEFSPGEVPTGPAVQGYNVPGRNPGSQMPWELFLGHAAHRLIAYMYGVNHPRNRAFYNKATLIGILRGEKLGDPSRLLPHERNLRPDITDVTTRFVFEIKPWNEQGLQEGQQESMAYVAALNRAVAPATSFMLGRDFNGEILIRFAQGQFIWRLEWRTSVPGVVQYRWTRSLQRFASQEEAYRAGQWVDITEQEMRQYGGWVAQAVDGMVDRRERLASFSGAVGVAIDVIGDIAVGVFSGFISGEPGARRPSVRPPTQGGGHVIPLPSRSVPSATPGRRPTGSGL